MPKLCIFANPGLCVLTSPSLNIPSFILSVSYSENLKCLDDVDKQVPFASAFDELLSISSKRIWTLSGRSPNDSQAGPKQPRMTNISLRSLAIAWSRSIGVRGSMAPKRTCSSGFWKPMSSRVTISPIFDQGHAYQHHSCKYQGGRKKTKCPTMLL